MFIQLRCRSAYSLLEGAMTVKAIKARALELQMPAIGICDRDNLFGALEFSETMAEAGIQPIIGMTAHLAYGPADPLRQMAPPLAEIALIASSEIGYRNLMALSTAGFFHKQADVQPQIDLETLETHEEGLFLLTGGPEGPLSRLVGNREAEAAEALLGRFERVFRDRLFVELQRYGDGKEALAESWLVEQAYERGIGLIATNDVHFETPQFQKAHTALLAIADGKYLTQANKREKTPQHAFVSQGEMVSRFADLPEAIENTAELARRVHFRPKVHAPILPRFVKGSQADEADELDRQAREGLEARLSRIDLAAPRADYDGRLQHELKVIRQMGFPGYFLIVADFIKWAKSQDIPVGPGRGSGAGSLVAWALTITDLDPLRFGLLFERFLNPERVSMPDFDIDFCQDRRGEVIDYVRDRYGTDRVAHIITFGTLQARAVLRDVGRVLQQPFGLVDRLTKLVPSTPANPVTLKEALKIEPGFKRARESEPSVGELIDMAVQLEGLYRNASTHAAGVVIGDRPLVELVPLYRDPRSELPATQFNMKWVEPAGLVKFDFLGLKTLTVISKAVSFIRQREPDFDISAIALDDPQTYALLASGHAIGVFQLESSGMRETLRKVKPDQIEDIIALISLYRPGPMKNIDTYVERKFGRAKADFLHPSLEPVLKETHGVIIYQEQVMQIAQILSGYSLGEADLLRRAMGKKKPEEMAKQKSRFLEGAERNQVSARLAADIFDLVAEFAGYGFNKSHAAAYALIAYQTAYLKARYPVEFMAGLMSLDRANTEKLASFAQEARRMGLTILPPDINRSMADFNVEGSAIRYALGAVKSVSFTGMEIVVKERIEGGDFSSLEDFARRLDPGSVNKRMLENLTKAGAFDCLEKRRSLAFASCEALLSAAQCAAKQRESLQTALFAASDEPDGTQWKVDAGPNWTAKRLADEEFSAIGFYLSGHPLDAWMPAWLKRGNRVIADIDLTASSPERETLRVPGVVRDLQERFSAKRKEKFAFLALSDPSGEIEMFVPGELLATQRDLLKVGEILSARVSIRRRGGEVRLTLESVEPMEETLRGAFGGMRVHLHHQAELGELCELVHTLSSKSANAISRGQLQFSIPIDADSAAQIILPGEWPIGPVIVDQLASLDDVSSVEEL
jgi:DNA polymerase III subunit alpha